jgi:heptosyltransferase-1
LSQVPGAVAHCSGIAGLIDATRRAAAVIGVDSGPLHLAAALNKPGVAIYGPTDPAINGPYGDSLQVLRAPDAVTSYKRRGEPDTSMWKALPDLVFEAVKAGLLV